MTPASKLVMVIFVALLAGQLRAQEQETPAAAYEQQMESLTEKQDAETRDDAHWQQLDGFHRHPIDLNNTTAEELQSLNLLTELQIVAFTKYRQLFGKLIHIYELQAVPGWDIMLIRQLLPYVTTGSVASLTERLFTRMRGGEKSLVFRIGEQLEKSKGFEQPADSGASHYAGSRQRIFFRYAYHYRNLLQYGLLGDKDAGEQFFKGHQRSGFDFYSFHLYARNAGIIKSLAIGDFTVNMGQGLIQWQTLAFTKSADVLAVKRQSELLRPYNSAGEYNFHRGAGITLKEGPWEITGFISSKKISANFVADTAGRENIVSAFQQSGYHRTSAENADKNNLRQTTAGGNVVFRQVNWHAGINAVWYTFSSPIKKQDQPYNLFAIQGKSWNNISLDYSYTFRNMHFFGEMAADKHLNLAMVHGLLISLHRDADAVIVYRNTDRAYQALYADAFTENTVPSNEKGLYVGASIRPLAGWRFDVFADSYHFPWLKYRVDAPSEGYDYSCQLLYQPGKTWNIYARYKVGEKEQNELPAGTVIPKLMFISRKEWRIGYDMHISRETRVRGMVDILWYDAKKPDSENGFLYAFDLVYKPFFKPYSGNIRLQYFETGGYNSRIYAFENDVLYSFSIPSFYDKGWRYYININLNIKKILHLNNSFRMKMATSLKWSQTIYPSKAIIGSGLDEIFSNKKSDLRIQFFWEW